MIDLTSLYDISREIVEVYRNQLKSDNIRTDGPLYNFTWNVNFNGVLFQLDFYLPPEWYWVEHGRRPSLKMPPVDNIEQWIKVRRLVPRAVNGKVPSTRSLAFAIAKKIQREGFYSPGHHGKHSLEKAMMSSDVLIQKLADAISDMLGKEITDDLIHVADGLSNIRTE